MQVLLLSLESRLWHQVYGNKKKDVTYRFFLSLRHSEKGRSEILSIDDTCVVCSEHFTANILVDVRRKGGR
jgi:hypothetical protein